MIAIITIISALLKPVIIPILTGLIGWLIPSPIKKAQNEVADVHNAEAKATKTPGNTSALDQLP